MSQTAALSTAPFDGRRLTLARLYSGLTKAALAIDVGVSPAAITQYEHGRTRPSAKVLALLALRLGFPVEFFVSNAPPLDFSEDQTHFRRLRSTTKMTRAQLLAKLELLAEVVALVEHEIELPPVDLPDLSSHRDASTFEGAAASLRDMWGLGTGPLDNVVRLLETRGVIVSRHAVNTRDVDAFSRWFGSRPMIVLSSDKDDRERGRFDSAHELGHLLLHHDAEPGRQSVEREANLFAGAFLLPREALLNELPRRVLWPSLFALKRRWGVSVAALLHRGYTLGVYSSHTYRRARIHIASNGWTKLEPGTSGPPEEPVLLARALGLMEEQLGVDRAALGARLAVPEDKLSVLLGDADQLRLRLSLSP